MLCVTAAHVHMRMQFPSISTVCKIVSAGFTAGVAPAENEDAYVCDKRPCMYSQSS